ncbi:MAG: PKD domain-containing protein [Candidatus Celaenobacter antarcticus]|nr:PKD domain-containing protein [Candidatus Celaenobacter antarcticus]
MKIKYLLILMFLLCFVSNAFGQIGKPNTFKSIINTQITLEKCEDYPQTKGWVNPCNIQGNNEEWHDGDGDWDEGNYPSDYPGPGTIPYSTWGALGLDTHNTWGYAYWTCNNVDQTADTVKINFRCMSNESGSGQYVEIYLRDFSNWEWIHVGTINDKENKAWTLTIDENGVQIYVSEDGRCDFIAGSNDGYVIDYIDFWYYEATLADLEITSVSISPTPPIDENESFTATVYFQNNGDGDAGQFYLDLFMDESSAPTIPCDGDFYTSIPGLSAGASSSFTFSHPDMNYSSTGTKHQYYVIDSYDHVPESNENNNVFGPHDVEVEEGNISIIVNSSPSGLKVKVDGSNKTTPYYTNWEPGSCHELEGYTQNKNNIKYAFDYWEDGSTTNPRTVYPTTDKTYTAYYNATHYYLDIDIQGQGSVSPTEGYYPINSTQTLTATPSTGWTFSHWSGDISISPNPCQIYMDSPKSVTAHFVEVDGIPCGVLVVKADNYNPELTEAWGNLKIKHIQNSDHLVLIPSGHAYINSQNNTVTIEDDDNFSIIGSSYWNFSGTSWDFDCNAGTSEISTTLGLGNYVGSMPFNGIINFCDEKIEEGTGSFLGYYAEYLPNVIFSITDFDNPEFGFFLSTGLDFEIWPIRIQLLNNDFGVSLNVSDGSIGIDLDSNIFSIGLIDGGFSFDPLGGSTFHVKWDGAQEQLVFTGDTGITIPIGKESEYIDEETLQMLEENGQIFYNEDRSRINIGLTIKEGSYINFNSGNFYFECSVSVGVDGLNVVIGSIEIGLNFDLGILHGELEAGINPFPIFEVEVGTNFEFAWGTGDYTFAGDFILDLWFASIYLDAGMKFHYKGSPYLAGWLNVYLSLLGWNIGANSTFELTTDYLIINGYYFDLGGKTITPIDSLNMEWNIDIANDRINGYIKEPLVIPETGIVLNDSSYFYCNTTDSTLNLSSTYDGIDLNWQLSPDPFEASLIKIDGITLSMASDADMRLESVEDTSRYIEIRTNGDFVRKGVDDLLTSCGRSQDPETGREWKIISVKSITGKSLNENFIAKIKNISNPDSCYFSYILANPVGKFVIYDNDILINDHSYYTNIYTDGSIIEVLKRDDEQQDVNKFHWDIENTTTGFSFSYISGEWNAIYDTLIVNVKTSEPSDCWLYYGDDPSSLQDTIQSSIGLSNEHQFSIYKDDIQSRWFYKIKASKEDGNTIYAGPLIVPPRGSPIADFYASPLEGVKPLEVVFTDSSEVGPSGAVIISWEWDFNNDGTIDSNIPNTTNTYTSSGHYTVSLTVTDINEESDTKIVQNMIEVWEPPIADFSAYPPLEGEPPLEVEFTDESTPGSGDIISWYWEFGDDSTSTEQYPIHTYTEEGYYDVTLTITDSNNLEDSLTIDNLIFVRYKPIAKFSAVNTIGVKPLIVNFTDESYHPGISEIDEWYWNFGDGADTTYTTFTDIITHTYPDSGHYTVSLKVTDTNNVSDTITKNNYIEVWEPPIASFSADPPLEEQPPLEVQFNDDSIPGSGEIISWYWEFGDDSTSTDENPTHEYTEEDYYDVTLTITDSNGLEDSITKENFIFVRYKPIAKFSAVDTIGVKPLIVNFTDESEHPGIAEIDEWYWEFGDGADTTYTTFIGTITHTYPDSGHYTVSLKVTDTNNVSDTKIDHNMIEVWEPPIANFSYSPDSGPPPLTVYFEDNSQPGSGEIVFWYWKFGDGIEDPGQHQDVTHTYHDPGCYYVTLIIRDSNGLENSLISEDCIRVYKGPEAKFSALPISGEPPLEVEFTDESIKGSGDINYWEWDFGDGKTSNAQNPIHNYEESGIYTVSLTVTDTNTESDTIIKENYIIVAENCFYPNPYNPESGIVGTFRYTPKSSGNYAITIYDVSNQIVIELNCGSQKTNEIFEFNWNGKNASGKDVANGTYFYIIKSNTGDSYMNKLSILK